MSTRSLPPRPSLDQLKRQAAELLSAHRAGHPSAGARIAAHHPRLKGASPAAVAAYALSLSEAQLVIAREYGFDTWAALKHRVNLAAVVGQFTPHPRFDDAVAALDAGDLERLRLLLASDPSLVHARTNLSPPYHYFSGATLLHHVAGNPDRGRLDGTLPPMPANTIEAARVLLDAGADVNAVTLGPNGGDTMGLLCTSKQASDAGLSGPLIDLLLRYGARLDLASDGCMDASLANHAPAAAERMIALGARPDVLVAAALGRMDLLRSLFDSDGHLLFSPRRHGREMSSRDAIGLALLYAYVRDQREAVEFLIEKDGNWDVTGVNNGTILHRAAFAGDLAMVKRLVALGADIHNRDNPFGATPLSWADHNQQAEVFQWLRAHCAIDLHDAVSFDLPEHVRARLAEDPSSVNRRIDHWDIPQGTALHWAAWQKRRELAVLLLESGADPNIVAGNGLTPLDVADASDAIDVALLLEQHGGTRTSRKPGDSKLPPVDGSPADAQPRSDPDGSGSKSGALPSYRIDLTRSTISLRPGFSERDWDTIVEVIVEKGIRGLEAGGQLTDGVLARLAHVPHLTRLAFGGTGHVTDAGLAHLSRMPQLEEIDLSDYPGGQITDRGLEVLRDLPNLRRFQMCWQSAVTDAGVAHLAACDRLESVDLLGTHTGDGAVAALAGKRHLHRLKTGRRTTDAALPLLHHFPVFKSWQGGDARYSLMSPDAEPNHLLLDGPITNAGLRHLAGLDGLFGLSFFWHLPAMSADGLAPLEHLPHLGFLGCEGRVCDDAAMRHIARIPQLRMLMAQGTVATDDGFAALSRSRTLEFLWGRECPNLGSRGFAALASLPALRGLAVSCRQVDDAALSMLPAFPALRDLMPMDVSDAGFRHIGRCAQLEQLWCMYCRDTTDAATAHLAGLTRLRTYYAGQTQITDQSLEILGRMPSLEKLEFWNCSGITDAGAARLTPLPRLREVTMDGCRQITAAVESLFPPHVRVRVS